MCRSAERLPLPPLARAATHPGARTARGRPSRRWAWAFPPAPHLPTAQRHPSLSPPPCSGSLSALNVVRCPVCAPCVRAHERERGHALMCRRSVAARRGVQRVRSGPAAACGAAAHLLGGPQIRQGPPAPVTPPPAQFPPPAAPGASYAGARTGKFSEILGKWIRSWGPSRWDPLAESENGSQAGGMRPGARPLCHAACGSPDRAPEIWAIAERWATSDPKGVRPAPSEGVRRLGAPVPI